MTSIVDATTSDIPVIQSIAEKTWWPTYSPILSSEQLSYMLAAIYSTEALKKAMTEKTQEFILLMEDQQPVAFAAYGARPTDPDVYKLHKLYVLPSAHGKGYGRKLLDEIAARLRSRNITKLDLNVNRFNPAKSFYERTGFKIIREEDVPVGPYFMNDYVMRMEI
jgi:diamine N-acetyltransferase